MLTARENFQQPEAVSPKPMPSPHNSVTVISRGRGQSAVASAAYRHATQTRLGRDGETRDYSAKAAELKHAEIMLPGDAALWAQVMFGGHAYDRALAEVAYEAEGRGEEMSDGAASRAAWALVSQGLWQSVEEGETLLNHRHREAQLARSVTIALPRMLNRGAQIALMRGYVAAAFTSRGMIADWVLHDTGDGNPHVHVMLTLREIGAQDWGLKNRDWNHVSVLRAQRALWVEHANAMLEREGFAERIDHRTLRDQQLEMDVDAGLLPETWNSHVADHADRVGDVARERMRCRDVRAANRAYLRAHPEHILVVVQSERAVFTERDIGAAFAKRLGLDPETEAETLGNLVAAAMASRDLLPVVGRGSGEQTYITAAKARQARQVGRDAERLAGLALAGTWGSATDAGSALLDGGANDGTGDATSRVLPDGLETGTGPILIDAGAFGEGAGDDRRGEHREGGADYGGPSKPGRERADGGVRGGDGDRDGDAVGVRSGRGDGASPAGPSAAVVREALDARAEEVFRAVFGEPLRPGAGEWRAKENAAVAMQMRGPRWGLWRDHSAGEGGDVLDLVARHYCGLGCARDDFPRVLEEAARWCGLSAGAHRPDTAVLRGLEARRADRERAAALEASRETARRMALVREVVGRAVPVTPGGTGASALAYLAGRGIETLPDEGLGWLPGVGRGAGPKGLLGAEHDALVVWAVDEAGAVTGGQRILVTSQGNRADVEVSKPSFGQISGSVARFAAREPAEGAQALRPLVIAEGPESALSIWQATGYETWAVFGVSGWRHAPVPTDRPVILAPDRDAHASPAGRAFRKALAHHLGRGCDLKVAVAPEVAGSKRDLNDTDQRAGPVAVRSAIRSARTVVPWVSADLNAGQRRAAEAMLGPDRLTLVTGHAGTGKTFTLSEVARIWQARGVQVLAGAPSGKATQALAGLGTDPSAEVPTATLSAWESRWARGDVPEQGNFVFLMDEAGMVGSGQWARLQSRIGAMGGKLIAVGDPEQLQPVMEVSGWALAEREVRAAGGEIPVIDMVMRQRDAGDRAATMALATGTRRGIEAGVRHYEDAFHPPRPAPDADTGFADPIEDLAEAFVGPVIPTSTGTPPAPFSERIALGYSNADVERLNGEIRDRAVRAGLVEEGRVFRAEQVERGSRNGLETRERRRTDIRIGAGDRVMLTRPLPEEDLSRSAFGTVTALCGTGFRVKMDGRDGEIEIDAERFPWFAYGYAATVHKAQGMTVDEAFVLSHRGMDRHALNVALTRHRDRVTVFGVGKDCETLEDLIRLAQRRPRLPRAPEAYGDVSLVPGADVPVRPDWTGARQVSPSATFQGDRHLMAVGSRVAGLLGADQADNDPLLADMETDAELADYAAEPTRVVDDLVARQGVVLAEEVAGVLARRVRDPETFLRIFAQAMAHEDLVALPRAAGRAGAEDVRVYTTQTLLDAELAALDRGLGLAMRGRADADNPVAATPPAPDGTAARGRSPGTALVPADVLAALSGSVSAGLDGDQRAALRGLLASPAVPGQRPERGQRRLRIVEGGTGSGKTRVAARLARGLEELGVPVTVVGATEAGRQALAEEGVEAITFGMYLSQPVLRSQPAVGSQPALGLRRVVIVDDAHGLGVDRSSGSGRGAVLLARIEAEGSELVAMVNPARRPAEAGPVFQRLAERLAEEDGAVLSLRGHHGPETEALRALSEGLQPERGHRPDQAVGALQAARAATGSPAAGLFKSGEDRDRALGMIARAYVADRHDDRLALGWSRKDVAALTLAIRARLDEIDPDRAAFVPAGHGPLKDLKPGDRIRFSASGMAGSPAHGDKAPAPGSLDQPEAHIARGDVAQVLGVDRAGHLRLRIGNAQGEHLREIAVPREAPLPAWNFAFASTVTGSAGRRHDSVHFLASPGMDREVLAAGAGVARQALNVVLPVAEDRLEATLAKMVSRDRAPRSGTDHGFDPEMSLDMARARAAQDEAQSVGMSPPVADMDEAGLTPDALAALTGVPHVPRATARVRAANAEYLRAHPEHILVILGTDRAVFTGADVRQGLRARLGSVIGDAELKVLGTRVLASPDLVRLSRRAPDGAPQYITRARAVHLAGLGADAARLAGEHFAPGGGPVLRPDALDGLHPVQALAADAMLDGRRLTLVTGHAGTGKTHTLKAVASEWQARGVRVLAGAPSGKATSGLKDAPGIEAATLAAWEARWSRGDVPAGKPFVFIMDEAGMVGAGQWSRIQSRILAMGGKLVAVGDPEQLQPVADLPGWALAERAAGGSVVMDTVIRQRDVLDRQATEALARGGAGAARAVRHYVEKDAVRLSPEVLADPVGALARDWVRAEGARPEATRVAVSYTNRDVAALNDAIRQARAEAGLLKGGRDYGTITRSLAGQDGQIETVALARRLAEGERVMLTRAVASHGLAKSTFGTVVATAESAVDVIFDDGQAAVRLEGPDVAALDYGYAATVHRAQGLSADEVHVLMHRRMHRHATYVALSRHRDRLSVYGRVGHVERPADLMRLAQAAGHLDMDPAETDRLAECGPSAGMVPGAGITGLGVRADWTALGGGTARGGLAGDAAAMGVAERVAGLLSGEYRRGDPVVRDGVSQAERDYLVAPARVIDDLILRSSVIRADDVAARLARVVAEPETFLRLYTEALGHSDLVRLAEDGKGAPVYTTGAQLRAEVRAVDIGARLAAGGAAEGAPAMVLDDLKRKDWRLKLRLENRMSPEQQLVLELAMEPSRLRLIRGETGAGKTRMAAETAALHAAAGWQVIPLAPTGAGLEALERAGLDHARTLRRFLRETAPGVDRNGEDVAPRVTLTPDTVIVLDDATRLGGAEATELLERVEASGARLVAFLGGEDQTPMGAGPVMRALEMRVGSIWLGPDQVRDAASARALGDLLKGGDRAEDAVARFADYGELVAGGTARRSIGRLAESYVADASADKVALTWSRADAAAVTKAIRARLDETLPERAQGVAPEDPFGDLKPGDRIRFTATTPWVARKDRDRNWAARRVFAGERADVTGRDAKTGGLVLRVTSRGSTPDRSAGSDPNAGSDRSAGSDRRGPDTRRVVIPPDRAGDLPDWGYAFAGTIHGEGALVRDSVHLLAGPGMSRQVLAAGVAAHQEHLRIVVPSSEARMNEVLTRIVRRDGRAEAALDYGFDPALGARAALKATDGIDRTAGSDRNAGVEGAIDRLARLAGITRNPDLQPAPVGAAAAVLAEVIGASVAQEGRGPENATRLALERYVRSLSDAREWRRLLRQVPASLPRQADALAAEAGLEQTSDRPLAPGRPLAVARYLARGALVARALGEESVAGLFEAGLMRFGDQVKEARITGDMERLQPSRVPERAQRGPERPKDMVAPEASEGRGPQVDPEGDVLVAPVQGALPLPESKGASDGRMDEVARASAKASGKATAARLTAEREEADATARPVVSPQPEGRTAPAKADFGAPVPVLGAEATRRLHRKIMDRLTRATPKEEVRERPQAPSATADVALRRPETPKQDAPASGKDARSVADTRPAHPTPEDRTLALQLAIAVSHHVLLSDPVHRRDLPEEIATLLVRDGGAPGDSPAQRVARLAARSDLTDAEQALVAGLGTAVSAAPLADADVLHRERAAVMNGLGAPDRPTPPPPALLNRMLASFTRAEVWALCDKEVPWPRSLPVLEDETRRELSATLSAAVAAESAAREAASAPTPDQPAKDIHPVPDDALEKDTPMDATTRKTKQEEVLVRLMAKTADKDTFDGLTTTFSFGEFQALQDPALPLPESLPTLTAANRQAIAAAIEAGPPRLVQSGGGQDAPPAFVPDPKYDGRALQLAGAITERVPFESPVHSRENLVGDIRALLRAADAARNLPEAQVDTLTRELTTARVTLDAKRDLAREAVAKDPKGPRAQVFMEDVFLEKVGERNSDRRHPLPFAHTDVQKEYDRFAPERVAQALAQSPEPTEAERSVARVASLPNRPEGTDGLVEALKYVFKEGSLTPAGEVMDQRTALLDEIAAIKEPPKQAETVLERVYRLFTHQEVFALARGDRALPATLPALDEDRKFAIRQGLQTVTKGRGLYGSYAWNEAGKRLDNGLHPERARSRSRGVGMAR